MDADDTLDELQRVMVPGAAAVSRAAEILIRYAQDQKVRRAMESARVTEELDRRTEAQARAAEQYFRSVGAPEWVRTADVDDVALAWKGAQQWRELDPERFGPHAENLTGLVRDAYGVSTEGEDLEEGTARVRAAISEARGQEAEHVVESAAEEHGYDTAERRAATAAELERAGVPAQAREAKMTADHLNGQDPRSAAAASTKGRARAKGGRQSRAGRDRGQGIGR